MGALVDQPGGGVALGVQRVRGDHRAGQVDGAEQVSQIRYLVGLRVDVTVG